MIPPPLYAMNAAPGSVLRYLHFILRGMFLQILSIHSEMLGTPCFYPVKTVGQGHLTETVVVAESLPVGCDVNDLRIILLF